MLDCIPVEEVSGVCCMSFSMRGIGILTTYHISGYFHGVLIFIILWLPLVTEVFTYNIIQ